MQHATTVDQASKEKFQRVLAKLVRQTLADPYDPFKELEWPDSIEMDRPWMTERLMSIHGVELDEPHTEQQKIELSKWELINFCSLNVTGIRELLVEMSARLHDDTFGHMAEYMHHLIAEENEHMWYFATFCTRYGGKIYKDRALGMAEVSESDIADFVIFSRILIFEEIVDYYNRVMGKDSSLPAVIQKINKLHHTDETRHIVYGRLYLELCHKALREKYPAERIRELEELTKVFMRISVQKLYRPEMYADAGIERPAQFRKQLLASPARDKFNRQLTKNTARYFADVGIFASDDVWGQPAA